MAEIDDLKREVEELKSQLEETKRILSEHTHNGSDGSSIIFNEPISMKPESIFRLSNAGFLGDVSGNFDVAQINAGDLLDGIQTEGKAFEESSVGVVNDRSSSRLHRIAGGGAPIYQKPSGATTTSGSASITIDNMTFQPNELAGLYISIVGDAGLADNSLFASISSNTSNTITIDRNSNLDAANVPFTIITPLYIGFPDRLMRRLYLIDGSGGGVRFGHGTTAQGENSLLYGNSSGLLKFRDKDGNDETVATSSETTGGSGSAGAGNQFVEINIGDTVYKVLHDGTV